MAIIATPGAADANSYGTLAEFSAYLASRAGVPVSVQDADDGMKESALLMATRLMRRLCWTGGPSTATQALAWPRAGMFNLNGVPIDSAVIPQELKDMQFEQAMLLLISDRTVDLPATAAGLSELKAGPVTLKFKEGATVEAIPDSVTLLGVPSWFCESLEDDLEYSLFQVL